MAMKKTTPPKPPRPGGNPGGRTSVKISPSVTVLGKTLSGFTGLSNPPRKALTPAQLKQAETLAAKIKALEVKAAADKKANAKIIKQQNKTKTTATPALDKAKKAAALAKKKVVKVTPPKGRPGLRGGGMGGGGLFGGRGIGGTR
jgi:hypothetical protein